MLELSIRPKNFRDPYPAIFFRQVWSEARLVLMRGINFRSRNNERARTAYAKMQLREFEGINARQQWANWRTVPKNLLGKLPSRPVLALDLCCGIGHSTEVLAYYLPLGSKILGLEFNPDFVECARRKQYEHQNGAPVEVSFRAQSVLDPFCDAHGKELPDGQIDLINCCGAVGSHFDPAMTLILAREVARVLKSGGLALIDSGVAGTTKKQLIAIFEAHGFQTLGSAKSCILDLSTQICFRKKLSVH